jgi:hypothetical protein
MTPALNSENRPGSPHWIISPLCALRDAFPPNLIGAGEFVREEMDKIRHGEHGVRSPQRPLQSVSRKRAVPASIFRRR